MMDLRLMILIESLLFLILFRKFSVGSFSSTPNAVSTCVGSDFQLLWTIDDKSDVYRLVWLKDGSTIMIQRNGQVIFKNTSAQHITDGIEITTAARTDSGTYKLTVYYTLDSKIDTVADTVTVTVKDPPSAPFSQVSGEGMQKTYTCNTSNSGYPMVDTKIKIGGILQQAASANIDFTQPVDCCVVGDAVTCMPNITDEETEFCTNILIPRGPDHMVLVPEWKSYTLNVGNTLSAINCSAICTPACTYRWMKDKSVVENGPVLSIKVQNKTDAGNYTCIASRGFYITANRSIYLSVRYGPTDVSFWPLESPVAENENKSLSVKCIADCYPRCEYRWRKQEGNTSISLKDTLFFETLTRYDRGEYTCVVTNSHHEISFTATGTVSILVRYGPDSVSLDPDTSFLTRNEHQLLTVTCQSVCVPACEYSWRKLNSSSGMDSLDGTLHFLSVKRTDSGSYMCTVNNVYSGINIIKAGTIEIAVRYGPDSVGLIPETTTYTQNVNTWFHAIKCSADCYPPCKYTWQKNGSTVAISNNLELEILQEEEAGTYICLANNTQTSVSAIANVTLYIRYGPKIINLNPDVTNYTILEGDRLNIICSSECYPKCSLYWTRESTDIVFQAGNVLAFHAVDRNYTGNYSCIATNDAEKFNLSLNKTVRVTVNYYPDVTIKQKSGKIITENYSNVTILCIAEGEPATYRFKSWIHYAPNSNKKIRELNSTMIHLDKASLTFQDTSYMDSGMYQCRVSNGIKDRKTGNLTATSYTDHIVKGRPVVIQSTSIVTAGTHQNASLWVAYYSNDGANITVTWFRNNSATREAITYQENMTVFENSAAEVNVTYYTEKIVQPGNITKLFITNVNQSNFGDYEIEISNSINTTVTRIRLIAQGPPDPPYEFLIVKSHTTSSSVFLTWMSGFHNGAEQAFYVQYNTSFSTWQNITAVEGGKQADTQFNVTIDQLSANTQYFFRIYSANEFGRSDFSTRVLMTRTAPEESEMPGNNDLIGPAVGGGFAGAFVIIGVVTFIWFFRRRTLKGTSADDCKKTILTPKRPHDTGGHDNATEINLNPMYESSDAVTLQPSNADVYAKVNKQSYPSNSGTPSDVYSVVKKAKGKDKKSKSKGRTTTDVYSAPLKKDKGILYENAETTKNKFGGADNVYENPVCSFSDEKPSRTKNDDGLIYIEVELPQQKHTQNKEPVIHGEDRTVYADVAFGKVGEPMPESDEEEK